ncbi:DegV family protein [Clostridium thermarum]|uniref:DegV family protein n=1 Tax=Clostridium thermarum TaxID=1716543 RepID=UPI0019400F7E|nr:DegV family protein [Clostridium thermarum]
MMKTILITDSCSDLPVKYATENNIVVVPLSFQFKGADHVDDFGKSISYKEFYEELRKGELSSTSQVNAYTFAEVFKKYISQGFSILYIGFSSALSGTYNSSCMARDEILAEYPSADISVIDSKCASMGLGLLVYYACERLKSGKSKDEVVNWIEENKLKLNHWFTVDDLHHLKRGGRVSATSAVIGTLLDIKPILNVNKEGRLIPISKVKGRKKSIKSLAEELKNRIVDPENQVIAISHGDCEDEARILEKLIREYVNVKNIIINYIGPVVGSHSGPGTIALFFFGKERSE